MLERKKNIMGAARLLRLGVIACGDHAVVRSLDWLHRDVAAQYKWRRMGSVSLHFPCICSERGAT
jgi:hypothetical protein